MRLEKYFVNSIYILVLWQSWFHEICVIINLTRIKAKTRNSPLINFFPVKSTLFCKTFTFTEFLPKMREREFQCSTAVEKWNIYSHWKNSVKSTTIYYCICKIDNLIFSRKFWQEKRLIFHNIHRTIVQNTKLDFCRFMEAFGATRFWTRLFDRCKTRCIGHWVVYLYQMFCNDNQVYYTTFHRNPILSKAKSKGM